MPILHTMNPGFIIPITLMFSATTSYQAHVIVRESIVEAGAEPGVEIVDWSHDPPPVQGPHGWTAHVRVLVSGSLAMATAFLALAMGHRAKSVVFHDVEPYTIERGYQPGEAFEVAA